MRARLVEVSVHPDRMGGHLVEVSVHADRVLVGFEMTQPMASASAQNAAYAGPYKEVGMASVAVSHGYASID